VFFQNKCVVNKQLIRVKKVVSQEMKTLIDVNEVYGHENLPSFNLCKANYR